MRSTTCCARSRCRTNCAAISCPPSPTLPEPYREVLVLRDVDELTAPETAERLNISIDAVKSRLHRARTMVRERLLSSGYLASEQA